MLPVFGVIGLLSGYLPAYTDRIEFWTFGGEGVRWLGTVVFCIGGALRLWPVFVLGKRFSGLVAIQPGHSLVTHGIYRTLRNPSYLGMLVIAVGWALAFRSGVGLLLAALTLIPLIARIHAEEALLRAKFGTEYEAYCSRSWRLIPGCINQLEAGECHRWSLPVPLPIHSRESSDATSVSGADGSR